MTAISRTVFVALTIVGSLILLAGTAAADPCMFDPSDETYKECAHVSMGECHHYTSTCEPANACMFDPSDDTYKECAHMSMGECHHYTSTCTP